MEIRCSYHAFHGDIAVHASMACGTASLDPSHDCLSRPDKLGREPMHSSTAWFGQIQFKDRRDGSATRSVTITIAEIVSQQVELFFIR